MFAVTRIRQKSDEEKKSAPPQMKRLFLEEEGLEPLNGMDD